MGNPEPRARARALRWIAVGAAAAACVGAAAWGPSVLRAAVLLAASVGLYDTGGLPEVLSHPVRVEPESIALPRGQLRSSKYTPIGVQRPPVAMLVHGAHPRGIDEPRLVAFARALAAAGLEVHTPELPELLAFQLTPRLVQDMSACAARLSRTSGRRVGAFGVSFAGGLLLLAGADEPGAGALDYVVALGAYADLRRLARHYAGESIMAPDGRRVDDRLDPYGARILATAYAEDLFARHEAEEARRALRLHLAERYRDSAQVRAGLSPAAQARLDEVLKSPSAALRARLRAIVQQHAAALAAVSPAGRLRPLRVPVFLLHGRADPIIPSVESEWLAREVPEDALERVLITPVLRHAETQGAPALIESVRLAVFIAAVLREAED